MRKLSNDKVFISETELYEICHRIVQGENYMRGPIQNPSWVNLPDEVHKHFKLLRAMHRPKLAWFHKYAFKMTLFCMVAITTLTVKILIENYFAR